MKAHLVQTDIAWEDRAENHRRVEAMLEAHAGLAPGDLVVLPEMFDTGFSFVLERTADRDGATLAWIQQKARRFGVTLHGARTVIGPDGRGRNRVTVADPAGAVICEYDKVHPFSFGRESEFFSGGDEVKAYRWRGGGSASAPGAAEECIVCPAICYDLRFPELFRRGMLMGAEVFALGANWPAPRALHRSVLSQARAIENQAYMLCVNRAGSDPHLTYSGGTMAFGPRGEALGALGDGPGILTVDIDLADARAWREMFPACRDIKLMK
ncbi:amidohydrolase [soil metagenome]